MNISEKIPQTSKSVIGPIKVKYMSINSSN